MNRVLGLACLVWFAGLAGAQDDALKKDMERLQGAWKMVAFETADAAAAKDIKIKGKIVFEGNKFIVFLDDTKFGEAEFKLDPSKKPKHIDVTPADGFNKGKTLLGIYEFDGDKLKLCSYDDPQVRPKSFAYEKGETGASITLERAKAGKKK